MKKIKNRLFLIFVSLAFGSVPIIQAHANTTYVWTPSSSNWAGTIVLDTSSSTNGNLGDIVSASLTTPQGTFAYDPSTAFNDSIPAAIGAYFTWNSSQIYTMYIGWEAGPYQVTAFEISPEGGPNGIQVTGGNSNGNFIENGSWIALTTWTITIIASPSNGGTVSGSGSFASGSSQTVTATANSGFSFANWTENGSVVSTSASYNFTLNENVSLVANFTQNLASVTVNANPTAGGTVTGGGTYAVGSQAQISAAASRFYTFANWSDGNTDTPRTITVPSAGATYTASFSPTAVITFYDEAPAPNSREVGHAFLSIYSPVTGKTIYYGYYPSILNDLFLSPGEIDDDRYTQWDVNIAYPMTPAQYQAAAAKITQYLVSQPYYSLVGFNCMAFVASIASAAGIELPDYQLAGYGIASPAVFGLSLFDVGDGNITPDGGLVTVSDPPDPLTPIDYEYIGIVNEGETNAASLASFIGLPYDFVNLGAVNANNSNGITLSIIGASTNLAVIALNWGDKSSFQEQSLSFSHFYSNGTYTADLLIVDAGAVHLYTMTVTVSSSQASSITVNVTPFSPGSIPNQNFVPASFVPGFNVIEPTSIAVISNGQAIISFLGISNWTYTIDAASNLTQGFSPIGTATADTNGVFQYSDPEATNFTSRFYRASYP
jgi:hypothetical protein